MAFLDQLEEFCSTGSKPVSFREFVTSPDYCNYPDMYEWWICQIENLPDKCNELILDGSIGSGKSTVGAFYFAYRVYLLFYDGSPQSKLGVPEITDIYCLYFSVNLKTAQSSGFSTIYSIFENSPWFKEHVPMNTKLKSEIEFIGKHFKIRFASDFAHQLSLNVAFFILDEANFKSGVGDGAADQYAEVTNLYDQLLDRQTSRFSSPDGVQDTLAILISSASFQTSFSETRKKIIKDSEHARALTGVKYMLCPEKYSKEMFKVFIGCGMSEPCIIKDEAHLHKILQGCQLLGTGQEDEFIREVPINLLENFKRNPVLALQNHCGVPTNITSGFMPNMKYLYNSYQDETVIPRVMQDYTLEASTGDDTELREFMLPQNFIHTERPHSMYLDLSVQHDTCALVLYRYDGEINGLHHHTRVFSLQIKPPHFPNSTSIRKIKQFVLDVSNVVNLVCFASDQYQSTQLRQEIREELGLDDIRLSMDSTDVPHMHWIRALVEERVHMIEDPELEEECRTQIHKWDKHRVEKPKGGKDDVFQANIAAFYLSDTYGVQLGSVDSLASGSQNLVNNMAFNKVLRQLGFK